MIENGAADQCAFGWVWDEDGKWWFLVYSIWFQHIPYDYYSKERNFSFGHDSRHFRYIRRHRSLCILLHALLYPFSIVAPRSRCFCPSSLTLLLLLVLLLMLLLSFRSNDHILFRKCKSNVSAQHKHNQIQIRRIITVISFRLLRCCRWPATIFTKRQANTHLQHIVEVIEKLCIREERKDDDQRMQEYGYVIKQRMIYLNAWARRFGHIFPKFCVCALGM